MHDVFEDTDRTRDDARAAGLGDYEISLAWACTDHQPWQRYVSTRTYRPPAGAAHGARSTTRSAMQDTTAR